MEGWYSNCECIYTTLSVLHAGLFSVIMRDMSNLTNTECPKWIVLDGDIDTMWIESLNTVMDDNKVQAHAHTHTHPIIIIL